MEQQVHDIVDILKEISASLKTIAGQQSTGLVKSLNPITGAESATDTSTGTSSADVVAGDTSSTGTVSGDGSVA